MFKMLRNNRGETPPAPPEPPAPPAPPADWTATMSPEHKAVIDVKGWKSSGDVISSYSDLEKLVGHEKIAMPKKDTNGNFEAGELNRVMTQLGAPSDSKDYQTGADFKLPEGMAIAPELESALKTRAREAGLLPSHYQFMMNELGNLITKGNDAQQAKTKADFDNASLELRTKWGLAYDNNAKLANSMIESFGGETAQEIVKKYGNDPAVIELLANVGKEFSEEQLIKTGMTGKVLTPEAAKLEIDKIRSERSKELNDANDPQHQYWTDKLSDYYKMQTGQG